jgi:uncharacterized protein (TIGR03435 family)
LTYRLVRRVIRVNDQMRLMMRSLLADRFKLAVRYENREVPVFAFVLWKSGKTPGVNGNPTAPDGSGLDPNFRPNHSDEFTLTLQRAFSD